MNFPSKVQMDLIERAARAVFPDFESLDVRGGEVVIYKTSGESKQFDPLADLVDALFVAESLLIEFAGLGALSAFARVKVGNEATISEKCGSSDELVKNHFYPPLCVAITRCAAMAWELKKCKQSQ